MTVGELINYLDYLVQAKALRLDGEVRVQAGDASMLLNTQHLAGNAKLGLDVNVNSVVDERDWDSHHISGDFWGV